MLVVFSQLVVFRIQGWMLRIRGREEEYSWRDRRGGFHILPLHLIRKAQASLRREIGFITNRQFHCALHKEMEKLNKVALCGQSRIIVQCKTL